MTTELLETTAVETKKTLRIVVTEEDIKEGCPRSILFCPVAVAAKRYLGGRSVSVLPLGCWHVKSPPSPWYICTYPEMYKLPDHVGEIIRNYDATGDMEPFTFEIEC